MRTQTASSSSSSSSSSLGKTPPLSRNLDNVSRSRFPEYSTACRTTVANRVSSYHHKHVRACGQIRASVPLFHQRGNIWAWGSRWWWRPPAHWPWNPSWRWWCHHARRTFGPAGPRWGPNPCSGRTREHLQLKRFFFSSRWNDDIWNFWRKLYGEQQNSQNSTKTFFAGSRATDSKFFPTRTLTGSLFQSSGTSWLR